MDKTGNVVPQDLIQLAPGEVLNIDFFKQAEAEVVPSSSLVELEVEVWVGVGVVVGVGAWVKMQFSFLTFSVRWVGGEMEIKANLSLSLVEVEAELGNDNSYA